MNFLLLFSNFPAPVPEFRGAGIRAGMFFFLQKTEKGPGKQPGPGITGAQRESFRQKRDYFSPVSAVFATSAWCSSIAVW